MTAEQKKRFEDLTNEPRSILELMTLAYNMAIEDAANSANVGSDYLPAKDDVQYYVDRESITKLKIQ